jgi:oxygen-independent coproporphyrinogen-3 oxidase
MAKEIEAKLIDKYNVSGPRYTSYPTVPFWKNPSLNATEWLESIQTNYSQFKNTECSIYIHLPFCESMCTFCGCHKRITKNHQVEEPYIRALLKEWAIYRNSLSFQPNIKELHFGGGTPTFFAPDILIQLLESIFGSKSVNPNDVDLSFEAHPNNTTDAHLKHLYDFGFRRMSLGIQDYNSTVQQAINRIQSFEQVKFVHNKALEIGYTSINHDLVYGLPKQNLADIDYTIQQTLKLKPHRIALYSYAHVPWIKGLGQRGFKDSDLPSASVKQEQYRIAKSKLIEAGYIEIGMDHFALPEDDLAKAMQKNNLHRNFMGYTTQKSQLLIGLGMSAISDSWFGFAQNEKVLEDYLERVEIGQLAITKGHLLSHLDIEIRAHIKNLMCTFETEFDNESPFSYLHHIIKERLMNMIDDQLVSVNGQCVSITDKGKPFVRNACMAFDVSLFDKISTEGLFSKTI